MSKILHFFPDNLFFEPYLQFLSRNYDISNHHFICWGDHKKYTYNPQLRETFCIHYSELEYKKFFDQYKNIFNTFKIMNLCNNYELIIFHSFYFTVPVHFFLLLKPNILKKSTWIIWGADVYYYLDKKGMYELFFEFLRESNIKNFNTIGTWFKCDYRLAQEWYHVKGEYKEVWYTNPDYILNKIGNRSDYTINIIVGNSSTRTNRHIEALELLSKFKDEKLKIFLPLSYGDPEYGNLVIKKAKELFGDKVIPMTDLISFDKYREFMATIDIGIFNNNRQQALGNIFLLLTSGSKVYVNEDSNLWTGLVEEKGFKVYSIKDIQRNSFKQFIEIDDQSINFNKVKARRIFDEEYQKSLWNNVFSRNKK